MFIKYNNLWEIIMATTKIWKVENRLDHVMDYTTNKEKTKHINRPISGSTYVLTKRILSCPLQN